MKTRFLKKKTLRKPTANDDTLPSFAKKKERKKESKHWP